MSAKSLFPPIKPLPGKKTDYSHVPSRVDCRRVVTNSTKNIAITPTPTVTRSSNTAATTEFRSRVPLIKPLPGTKMAFPHVHFRVDCRHVVTNSTNNITITPTVTAAARSSNTAATVGFRSRIPVRIPGSLMSQEKQTIPLVQCSTPCKLSFPSKIPVRVTSLGNVSIPPTSDGVSTDHFKVVLAEGTYLESDDESRADQETLPMSETTLSTEDKTCLEDEDEDDDACWDMMGDWVSELDQKPDEEEVRKFKLLEDQQISPPPVEPPISYRRLFKLKQRQYTKPELATIPEENEDDEY